MFQRGLFGCNWEESCFVSVRESELFLLTISTQR